MGVGNILLFVLFRGKMHVRVSIFKIFPKSQKLMAVNAGFNSISSSEFKQLLAIIGFLIDT